MDSSGPRAAPVTAVPPSHNPGAEDVELRPACSPHIGPPANLFGGCSQRWRPAPGPPLHRLTIQRGEERNTAPPAPRNSSWTPHLRASFTSVKGEWADGGRRGKQGKANPFDLVLLEKHDFLSLLSAVGRGRGPPAPHELATWVRMRGSGTLPWCRKCHNRGYSS